MIVEEIMSKGVISVTPNTSVDYSVNLMKDKNLGILPITENKKLKGVVTDRDVILRCVSEGKDTKSTPIEHIMTTDVVTVLPQQSVLEATRLMAKSKVRRLMVCEKNNDLVGVLSVCDIARQKKMDMEVALAISEISKK